LPAFTCREVWTTLSQYFSHKPANTFTITEGISPDKQL
jgi:hypothetical protein